MQQTKQSNGTGLALLWEKEGEGGGEGGGGGQHSKAGNRQADREQRSDTPPAPLGFDQHVDLDSKGGRGEASCSPGSCAVSMPPVDCSPLRAPKAEGERGKEK